MTVSEISFRDYNTFTTVAQFYIYLYILAASDIQIHTPHVFVRFTGVLMIAYARLLRLRVTDGDYDCHIYKMRLMVGISDKGQFMSIFF